jgi:hypothetical protein
MRRYVRKAILLLLLAVPLAPAPARAQAPLPPLAYVCPMHPEQVDDKPGQCPVCKMALEPIRMDAKYWCPVHQTLEVSDAPGRCRRDGRELVPVTLRIFWTCQGSDDKLNDPGTCAGGQPRRIHYELRAHGDHNPHHGGQFFMAEDQWHHLEGTYPSAGLFRVYFYDNFSRPMPAAAFSGSLVLLDRMQNEVASYPLKPGADPTTLEATVPAAQAGLPLNAAARIAFTPGKKPQLFNFPFSKYTVDPSAKAPAVGQPQAAWAPPRGALRAAPAWGVRPVRFTQTQAPAPQPAPLILDSPLQISAALAAALDETALPATVPELVSLLTSRLKSIQALVADGNLGQAWLPAMATKTVALALADHADALPVRARAVALDATRDVILSAWEIDNFGDAGNLQGITSAVARMESAVADLKEAYAPAL